MAAPVQGADVPVFLCLLPCPLAPNDANRLTLISNRQSDNDVISSFAYAVHEHQTTKNSIMSPISHLA